MWGELVRWKSLHQLLLNVEQQVVDLVSVQREGVAAGNLNPTSLVAHVAQRTPRIGEVQRQVADAQIYGFSGDVRISLCHLLATEYVVPYTGQGAVQAVEVSPR